MNAERHWQAALGQLQMEMPRAAFDTWVRDAEFITYEDGEFIIGVQNAYARDWLEDRLQSTAKRVLTGILNRTVGVKFIVLQGVFTDDDVQEPILAKAETYGDQDRFTSSVNNRYTFETFVVGKGNRLAHAAARAVAESPAKAYNPLFLYGGVGLGKTHLLHAIGHECLDAGMQVRYVSSEEFTNDLVDAIRARNTTVFRERYRSVDVLLIDDIQFIAGKEATQEEFFHTFNTLHGQEKQVVISSDRSPKAFVTLEERLRSRFEWGLTADIHAPDYETRLAILRSRTERSGRKAPDVILGEIAERVQSNIRELEGALTRVLAYADLRCENLTPNLVDAALADMVIRSSSVTTEQIISVVADQFGVEEDRLLSRERSREIAFPRQIAMYLIREETNKSLPKIGEALGGRDHTTVMYGCEKIADQLEIDDTLRQQVMSLRDRLYTH